MNKTGVWAIAWICHFPTYQTPMTFFVDGDKAWVVGNLGTDSVDHRSRWDGVEIFVEWGGLAEPTVDIILPDGRAVESRHTVEPTPDMKGLHPAWS